MTAKKNYDRAYAEKRRAPFEFVWDGRDWELPHMRDVDIELLREIQGTDNMDLDAILALMPRLFVKATDRQAWKDTAKPSAILIDIFSDWLAHAGQDAGESSASTDSSASTERPSKRTSTGSTASASRKRSTPRKRAAATPPASS